MAIKSFILELVNSFCFWIKAFESICVFRSINSRLGKISGWCRSQISDAILVKLKFSEKAAFFSNLFAFSPYLNFTSKAFPICTSKLVFELRCLCSFLVSVCLSRCLDQIVSGGKGLAGLIGFSLAFGFES